MDVENVTLCFMETLKLPLFTWFWNMDEIFRRDIIYVSLVEFAATRNHFLIPRTWNDIAKFIMKRPKDHMWIPVPDHNRQDETAVQVPDQDLDHLERETVPGLQNEDGVHLLIGVRHLVVRVRLQVVVHLLPADDHLLLVGDHPLHHPGGVIAMEV